MARTWQSAIALVGLLCVASSWAAADWRVWTATDTRRVLREDPPEAQTAAKLAAARNEWRGFQILIRADAPVQGIRVEPGDLVGPGGAVLAAGKSRIFRQHQLHLTEASYRNDAFRPGWYPDPLIPAVHPVTGKPLAGARFSAMPFDLPAHETHGFWVDLYVPAGTKPGRVSRGLPGRGGRRQASRGSRHADRLGFPIAEVPDAADFVRLAAAQREALQREARQGRPRKTPTDWNAVDVQVAQMLSENGIDATPSVSLTPAAQPDGSFRIAPESISALARVRRPVPRQHGP